MDAYCLEVRKPKNTFSSLEFHHVARDNNVAADILSKLESTRTLVPAGVFVHELHKPSIAELAPSKTTNRGNNEPDREVLMINVDWRTLFINYIKEHKLLPDKQK
ncbi:uncharacterized protein LOC101779702 [Setaria italica]|uniref:uncharacterized protein LOC101779702 n=1 Tax=Setaria italica TaxID=4555 RepID=UPI0003509E88|nr:uncharacterized protein LOC101779702 [Setaria italica]